MICLVINGPTFEKAQDQVERAKGVGDILEFRLDLFETLDFEPLKILRESLSLPVIFTLRSTSEGGGFLGSKEECEVIIHELLKLKPDYVDCEEGVEVILPSDIKLIRSHHNFDTTPDDLDEVFYRLEMGGADLIKISTTAQSTNDAMKMLCLLQKYPGKVLGMCMGEAGQITRILAPIFNAPWTYATLSDAESTAPGQLTAETLINQYRYRTLTSETAIYGLIGDPVTTSISDVTHNKTFGEKGIDAVYVKLRISQEELKTFCKLARQLPFRGLSVTMPLKEVIIPFLDHVDSEAMRIGAVNTIVNRDGEWTGYNTDGIGALNALEEVVKVQGKKVVILGAGGVAKAIAYEAVKRGADVVVLNRSLEKAMALAKQFGCQSGSLDELPDDYAILVNGIPLSLPIDPKSFNSDRVVMETKIRPKETELAIKAQEFGCHIVYGEDMFHAQAEGQFALWFDIN